MRTSKLLTLDTAQHGDAKVLAGPDSWGWYHIQVGAGREGWNWPLVLSEAR